MTQKNIHNILIKADDACKGRIIEEFNCDIEAIKEFESMLANLINVSADAIGKAWAYMNEELK